MENYKTDSIFLILTRNFAGLTCVGKHKNGLNQRNNMFFSLLQLWTGAIWKTSVYKLNPYIGSFFVWCVGINLSLYIDAGVIVILN